MASDFPFFRVKASDISSRVKKSVAKLHSCKKKSFRKWMESGLKLTVMSLHFQSLQKSDKDPRRINFKSSRKTPLVRAVGTKGACSAVERLFLSHFLAKIEAKAVPLNVLIVIICPLRFTDLPKALLLGCKVIKIYFC